MHFQSSKLPLKLTLLLLLYLTALHGLPVFAVHDTITATVTVGNIEISGNKKTNNNIIRRELLINSGFTCTASEFSQRINQSRLNLLNTSLFNFVTIDTVPVYEPGVAVSVNVKITVIERWYLWPVPILQMTDRNFNAWLENHDFTRLNYGVDLKWYNFTGRMDEFDATLQAGKNHQFSIAYSDPYIDKGKHFGLGFETGYKKYRETGYVTQNDKLMFSFVPDGLFTEQYFTLSSTYRKNIFTQHQLVIGYRNFHFSDSLMALNPDYSYTDEDRPLFLYVYYKLKVDHRDIKYYPLKGWYADIELSKSGLGFGFEKPVNVAWAKTTTRYYWKLASRWYSGISFIGKISSRTFQPYFQIQGLGYNRDYVRGYEYNVIDGKHFGLVRSNIKFALIQEQVHNLGFIPSPKFGLIHYAMYISAFADAAYVWQPQWVGEFNNKLPRTLLASAGLGIDMVTYYDKVIRLEYAVNKSGKSGIFIHFIAGI